MGVRQLSVMAVMALCAISLTRQRYKLCFTFQCYFLYFLNSQTQIRNIYHKRCEYPQMLCCCTPFGSIETECVDFLSGFGLETSAFHQAQFQIEGYLHVHACKICNRRTKLMGLYFSSVFAQFASAIDLCIHRTAICS